MKKSAGMAFVELKTYKQSKSSWAEIQIMSAGEGRYNR
jgi:hypothetical protein